VEKKLLICISSLLLFCSSELVAQASPLPLGERGTHLIERWNILGGDLKPGWSAASRPFLRDDAADYALWADSNLALQEDKKGLSWNINYLLDDQGEWYYNRTGEERLTQDPKLKWLYRERASLFHYDGEAISVRVNPVIQFELGSESGSNDFRYINTRGAELRGVIDQKVGFYVSATDNQGRFPQTVHDYSRERFQIMPGEGRAKSIRSDTLFFGEGGLDFFAVRGGISFPVTKHIHVRFAQDKNFIGNGYRSLILSDVGKDYLFLDIRTRVWKFEYRNLFAELADYRQVNIADDPIQKKYMALHRLSLQIGRQAEIGLFENIIFSPQDSTGRNGFELQYLNPMIFYRAVEFNLGSADNVSLGLDFRVDLFKSLRLYGQFILDEFNLSKFREGDGWWANKFGLQGGLHYINVAGIRNLDLQTEFNIVRPYTYSHFELGSNYTHFSQALAHPLGANFREGLAILRYQPIGTLDLSLRYIMASKGLDSDSLSYGGDIFRDNDERISEFGNVITQGDLQKLHILGFTASWQFFHDMFLDFHYILRREEVETAISVGAENRNYVGLGVRVNIADRRWDF
jgi:hypothetical protein